MDAKQRMDFIHNIENKFEVDTWEVDNVKVWPIVRIRLSFYLLDLHYYKNPITQTVYKKYFDFFLKSISVTIRRLVLFVMNFNFDFFRRRTYKYYFLTLSFDKIRLKNKYYNRLVDPLLDQLGHRSCLVEEFSTTECFKHPSYNSNGYIYFRLYFLNLKSLFSLKKSNNVDSLSGYNLFLTELGNSGISPFSFSTEILKRKVRFIKHGEKYFIKKFRKFAVEHVFSTEYYSMLSFAMISAANNMGLKTYDIQHGVQNEFHFAYAKWNRLPVNGYNLIPAFFLVWSHEECAQIVSWNRSTLLYKPIITGNLLLNEFKTGKVELIKNLNSEASGLVDKNKINILVSLQDTPLPTWFIYIIKNSINIKWWFRGHPSWRNIQTDTFEILGLQNNDINEQLKMSELPLYSTIQAVHLNVTQSSTTVIEAALLGKPTIIIDIDGVLYYKKYIEKGFAYSVNNESEFISTLEILISKKTRYIESCAQFDLKSMLNNIVRA